MFLIDGTASHGNSGSPVITLGSDYHRLAGMITSVVIDRINLYEEKGALTADFPYNAGLARAVRASLILDAVKKAEKKLSEWDLPVGCGDPPRRPRSRRLQPACPVRYRVVVGRLLRIVGLDAESLP